MHSLSRLCTHEVSQESGCKSLSWTGSHTAQGEKGPEFPLIFLGLRGHFCCFHLEKRNFIWGKRKRVNYELEKESEGEVKKWKKSNSNRSLGRVRWKIRRRQRQLSARLRFIPQDLHCLLLSAGTRLCSHQTFDKGLFHTALLFLRLGAVMCLGREINESRVSPGNRVARKHRGGPSLAARQLRPHAPTQRPWLLALLAEMGSHTTQRRPKSEKMK